MSDFFGSIANFFSDGANWLAKALGIWAPPPPKQRLPSTPKPTGGTPTPKPSAKPVVGSTQKGQADVRLNKLPEKDRKRYDSIVASAKSDSERGYLTKALASNHSIDEIEAFSKKIQGKDEKWQQDNLKLTANSSGKGVKQQWSHSCNATTVQAVQAELDPIYALKLHEENTDLTGADDADGAKKNAKLAAEQKAMLESKYSGGVTGAVGYAGKAAARGKGAEGVGRWADGLSTHPGRCTVRARKRGWPGRRAAELFRCLHCRPSRHSGNFRPYRCGYENPRLDLAQGAGSGFAARLDRPDFEDGRMVA